MIQEQPNIIVLLADDLGYGDLGCYGATKIPTPHTDLVASQGMRFTDAHASSALCTPSRYSVLTGRYCWRSRLKSYVLGGFSFPLIDPGRLTLASMLRSRGYATAAVGKWHLGLEWQPQDGTEVRTEGWNETGNVDYTKRINGGPVDLGFDYFFGIAGAMNMPPWVFIENDHVVEIPSVEKSPYNAPQVSGMMVPGWRDDEVDLRHTEKAIDFIERHVEGDTEKPFFLYFAPSAPHRPCVPPDFLRGASDAGPRGDMVMVFDWIVGKTAELLDRLGIAENTLLIVASDNGALPADLDGETYAHRSCGELRGFKGDVWEGGHRVPLIARWPGHIQPGVARSETVSIMDLMATFGDLTGGDLPLNAGEDSVSILSILDGSASKQTNRPAMVHHSGRGLFGLRSDKWKLIFGPGGDLPADSTHEYNPNVGQVYDLDRDLGETTNLLGDNADLFRQGRHTLQEIIDTSVKKQRDIT